MSEPNNLEWLSKLTDECFYEENYAGARVHFELAITAKINEIEKEAYKKAIDYFYWRIDCSTLISELEGWRGCIDNAKDQTERHFAAELRKRKDEVL